MISNMERVLKKSRAEALEEGREKGRQEGLEKGLEQAIIKIARQMLVEGEPIEKIVKYTGLPKDDIEKLN